MLARVSSLARHAEGGLWAIVFGKPLMALVSSHRRCRRRRDRLRSCGDMSLLLVLGALGRLLGSCWLSA